MMFASADGDSGARPQDLLEARTRAVTKRKNSSNEHSKAKREKQAAELKAATTSKSQRGIRGICPECGTAYSPSHLSLHRKKVHGVQPRRRGERGIDYAVIRVEVTETLTVCPECEALCRSSGPKRIGLHRREAHGVTFRSGQKHNYQRIVRVVEP